MSLTNIKKEDVKFSSSVHDNIRNSKNTSKSLINLSTLDYEKIADLQNKFDKFNQPKCALKVDREHSVAHILSNMEQDKIQELRAKFENLNMKRAVTEQSGSDHELEDAARRKSTRENMEEFRKVREGIERNILEREMLILDKKKSDATRTVNIKRISKIWQVDDSDKIPKRRNLMQTNNKEGENYMGNTSNLITAVPKDDSFANGNDAGSLDTIYRMITKNSTGFFIWRVENLQLMLVPKDQYGTFHDKECYIIFAATRYGQPLGPKSVARDIRGKIEYHIHFWLGSSTSGDKAGVAAYKTVEIDNYIGGSATQHREAQGKESPRFKSYFTSGMKVLSGVTELNRHVEELFEPRLFRVKGHRAPILTQMSQISWEHFTSGDVFLLHTRSILFIWIGRSANPIEKLYGTKAAMQLKTDFDTPNLIFVDDGYEKTLEDDDRSEFEKFLPLELRQVKVADEVEDDTINEKIYRAKIKLYHCCDHNGKYRITEVKTGPLKQEDLNHDDVILIDHGWNGIWVWVGNGANNKERVEAIRNARGFVKKKKYPSNTPVSRVVDGAEPIEFKSLFTVWHDKDETKGIAPFKNKIAVLKVTRFDAQTMHERPALAAKSQLLDDGTGQMRVWRIKRFEAMELPKERFGIFFTADCYVVLYNYKSTNGMQCMIYYWMGYHSVPDEQGVAALKSIELDASTVYGRAIHARVWQDKEPAHFLQLFKGRMCVFSGKGTDFDVSGKNLKTSNHYLLHIQGSATYNTRATQVALKASSLNSNYCYVLRKGSAYYIWCGSSSTGDNREMAKLFVALDFTLLLEGSETADFWSAICGKQEYKSYKYPERTESTQPPRLFQCSTATGLFKAEEMLNFVQKDLTPEDVMLLDAHNTIYLWIGNQSTSEEQRLSFETAFEYLKTDPCGRDMKTPIIQLRQGFEPPTFTGFFQVWDDNMWKNHKTYEELRCEVETRIGSCDRFISSKSSSESEFDKYNKYSVNVLRGPVENLPPSVDLLRKELHLTYDDFTTIFNMEYKEFEKIPLWKQQEMKKHVGLF